MRVGSGGVSVVVWSGVCREVIRLGGEIGMGVMGAVKSMRGEKGGECQIFFPLRG